MKLPIRKLYKKLANGSYRQCQEIKCTECGATTYPETCKTQDSLARSCNVCDTLKTAKRRGLHDLVLPRQKRHEIKKRDMKLEEKRSVSHGLSHLKLYKRWLGMLRRCYDKNDPHYEEYGGRGITVCDEWIDFSMFYWHMGEVPDGMELDRVDNDYIYCPENVRWVTPQKNIKNRRPQFKKGRARKNYGWWQDLGLKNNPYIYGPMPWKRNSLVLPFLN